MFIQNYRKKGHSIQEKLKHVNLFMKKESKIHGGFSVIQ